MIEVRIRKSPNRLKKYRAIFEDGTYVDFGQAGASDYTIHKDFDRMVRYLGRHTHAHDWDHVRKLENVKSTKERWGKDGIHTAGFWSRWFLWSEPSKRAAIRRIEKKFSVKIKF